MTSSEVRDRVLGERYQLLGPLGRGGMGSVWLAEDLLLRRQVALKELIDDCRTENRAQRRKRIIREARALARLDHPAIVRIYDIIVEKGDPWIVMEYVRGQSLAELLDNGPLDERMTARIGLRMLGALETAHRADVLHRDVKPSNIIVTEGGKASLVDFGVALIGGATSVTAGNAVLGTIEFLAPERLGGAQAAPPADLWALGVTLYCALEGHTPFHQSGERHIAALMWAIMNVTPPPPKATPALVDAVMGLLDRDPSRRLRADALAPILRSIANSLPAAKARARVPLPRATSPATEEAARLASLPATSIRNAIAGRDRAFAGRVLLALAAPQAVHVLATCEPRLAGELLDAMATDPRAAASVISGLSAPFAIRAITHMDRTKAAAVLAAMSAGAAAQLLRQIDARIVADLLSVFPLGVASRQLEVMSVQRACAVLDRVPPVVAASLLRDCVDGRADQLLRGLSSPVRTQVLRHKH